MTDKERIDFLERHPNSIRNSKKGIMTAGINEWQPNLRIAIDKAADLLAQWCSTRHFGSYKDWLKRKEQELKSQESTTPE